MARRSLARARPCARCAIASSVAIAELVCAVHWFDPLAWLTRQRWRKERELAADEDVVVRGVRPSDYATHLLDVAGAVGARGFPRGALATAGEP